MAVTRLNYSIVQHPFRRLFCELINFKSLEYMHYEIDNGSDTPGKENNSPIHKKFYDNMRGSEFIDIYTRFIEKEIRPQFTGEIVYQKYPTLRIQIANGKGVPDYHVDVDYNHPVEETNIWLPFTEARGTASIFIESEPGKKDYTSQTVYYGEYITFEGGKLAHGNEVNITGKTRVSIDMRVIPVLQFKPSQLRGLSYGKVRDIKGEDAYYAVI